MIRVNWDVEELVALIDLYIRETNGKVSDLSSEMLSLSSALNRRADILGIPHDDKFRNMSGMKLMYQNVAYIATNGARGLSSHSKAMEIVYALVKNCPDAFRLILLEFNSRYHIQK